MKKNVFAVLVVLALSGFWLLTAEESISERLSEILEPDVVQALLNDAPVRSMKYGENDMSTTLNPKSKVADQTLKAWEHGKPVFMIESLYLHKKQNYENLKNIDEILHSVSKLEGIEYYSASRDEMRTLYEKSYAVEKIVGKNKKAEYRKVSDPLTSDSMLVLQKDLTFGEYIYKYNYYKANNEYGFTCENTEKLTYSFFNITLVNPYELNVALSVVDLGDYLLVYVNTKANCMKLNAVKNKMNASFSNRADAIYSWFIKEYEN